MGSKIVEAMNNEVTKGKVDDETFKKAILDYRERIFLVILRFVKNRDDAKDLTQDVFIRAYRSRDSFRGDSSIFTWLYRIAINLALNHKSRGHVMSSFDDAPEFPNNDDPSGSLLNAELGRNIEAAVAALPTRQKAVFILRYHEEKSHAEIASILGITEGAVKANYHQAIKKLRRGLKEYVKGETP
jgi:RNA polymerase sigma factor (sigma-70 family)